MSADKLNQSLEEIMKDTKAARPRRGKPVRKAAAKAKAAMAPIGGVSKNRKGAKPAPPTAPAIAVPNTGDSKILISGLAADVTEEMLKEYFDKQFGKVRRVLLTYDRNGRSTGVATVFFVKPSVAADAARGCDGLMIDKRPIKAELIIGAKNLSNPAPQKKLSDRVSQPKNAAKEKAKPATNGKAATKGANGVAKGNRENKKNSGRAGRPKPKTAEELDAEMQDYFGGDGVTGATTNGNADTNGTAQPVVASTNGGDTGMDDEIS